VRDEFNDLAVRAKAAASRLDTAIWEAQANENRATLDKVLDQFIPTVDKSVLKGRDIVFLINKSEAMGEGYQSPIGASLAVASELSAATGGHDAKVTGILWDAGYTKSVSLHDSDRLDKAREKSKSAAKDLLPAVKEIMVSNTPDRQDGRRKHYIVLSAGTITDNIDHSAEMINTAMKMNPRLTFDFVSFGTGEGNVKDLVAKLTPPAGAQEVGNFHVPKHEDLHGVIIGILTTRMKGLAPDAQPAPKVEAAVVPEAPKTEAVKPAEVVPAAPAPDAPKAEAPAVATAQAAVPTTLGSRKKWYKPWGNGT
jgi:hypothetical protein